MYISNKHCGFFYHRPQAHGFNMINYIDPQHPIGKGDNSSGRVRGAGAQPSSRERAAAGGPAGRVHGPIV